MFTIQKIRDYARQKLLLEEKVVEVCLGDNQALIINKTKFVLNGIFFNYICIEVARTQTQTAP